jgi:excisionase family DNA binding protein
VKSRSGAGTHHAYPTATGLHEGAAENIYHCVNFSPVLAFPAMQGYVTTTEAAERLGVSSARVRQLVASGTLPAQKFGPVNMVKESDLELVRNRPGVGRPPKAAKKGEKR